MGILSERRSSSLASQVVSRAIVLLPPLAGGMRGISASTLELSGAHPGYHRGLGLERNTTIVTRLCATLNTFVLDAF